MKILKPKELLSKYRELPKLKKVITTIVIMPVILFAGLFVYSTVVVLTDYALGTNFSKTVNDAGYQAEQVEIQKQKELDEAIEELEKQQAKEQAEKQEAKAQSEKEKKEKKELEKQEAKEQGEKEKKEKEELEKQKKLAEQEEAKKEEPKKEKPKTEKVKPELTSKYLKSILKDDHFDKLKVKVEYEEIVNITLEAQDGFNSDMTVGVNTSNMIKILEVLKKDKLIKDNQFVKVNFLGNMIDNLGNESEGSWLMVTYDGDMINKMNYDNLTRAMVLKNANSVGMPKDIREGLKSNKEFGFLK